MIAYILRFILTLRTMCIRATLNPIIDQSWELQIIVIEKVEVCLDVEEPPHPLLPLHLPRPPLHLQRYMPNGPQFVCPLRQMVNVVNLLCLDLSGEISKGRHALLSCISAAVLFRNSMYLLLSIYICLGAGGQDEHTHTHTHTRLWFPFRCEHIFKATIF